MLRYSHASTRVSQSGIGKLTLLVFGTIIGAALYSAYQIFPFYYYYLEMENQMAQVIRVASTNSDQEIRDKLLTHMRWLQIPARPEDLRIERLGKRMRISLPYEEVFYVRWRGKIYDLYIFKFNALAEGEF